MNRLPAEILCEIFLYSVLLSSRFSLSVQSSSRESIRTPLRVSHVCQTWRRLALSDGRIWSYLEVDPSCFRSPGPEVLRDIFDAWIVRSKKAPLGFGVRFDFSEDSPREEELRCAVHIATTLVKQHYRWEDIVFDWAWKDGHSPSGVGTSSIVGMPMLTSLRMSYGRQSRITFDFGQSPRLRTVNIRGNFSVSACEGTLQCLKEFSTLVFRDGGGATDTVRSCQNFLASAPYLDELHLDFGEGLSRLTSPLEDNRPVYPGLRHLMLFSEKGLAEDFLDNVTLPSLHSLYYCSDSPQGGQKLLQFIERSLPPLTYLAVDAPFVSQDTVIPCLRLLPSLEQLELAGTFVSARFLRRLSVPATPTDTICPGIKALSVYFVQSPEDYEACAEALISMLDTRASIAPTFRDARIHKLGNDEVVDVSHFRERDQRAGGWLLMKILVGNIHRPFTSGNNGGVSSKVASHLHSSLTLSLVL